jgi:hypothetical protein
MINDLERRQGNILETQAAIADLYQDFVNSIGLAQLILTWRCIEELARSLHS